MKHNKIMKALGFIILFAIFVSFISLGSFLYLEKQNTSKSDNLDKVYIIGKYSINDQKEYTELPSDGQLNIKGNNKVSIEGNFNKDIPINAQLMLRIDNMKVKIFINDKLFYSFGHENDSVSYANSSGNLWCSTISPGIKSSDIIKIELYNVYTDHVNTTFSSFLQNIYIGYESELILNIINQNLFSSFVSIFIICIGIISIGFAYITIKTKDASRKLLYFGGLCISSGIWFFLDFDLQNYLLPYPIFNNSLDILSLLFSMFFLIAYFSLYLENKPKFILLSLSITLLGFITVTTILQLLGMKDYYESLIYIQGVCIIYTPLIVFCIYCENKNNKIKKMDNFLVSTIILSIGIVVDAISNMLDIMPYLVWFKLSYAIFTVVQFMYITKIIRSALLESARIQILEDLAYQDGLTGIKNRTAYIEKINTLQLHTSKQSFVVIVFDINNLKLVNDTLGHEFGDSLIKNGANILLSVFDKECIYRIGGDEFVVILENISESNYLKLINKFECELKNNNNTKLDESYLSIAYGYAMFDSDVDISYEDTFSRADKNMYLNKSKTKHLNTFVL